MKKILYLLFMFSFFSCKKEDAKPAVPADISNLTGEPRVGAVLLKWKLPVDSNFLYAEVRYLRKGETRTVKVSKFTDSVLITDLLNKLEYSFEVQTFNATKTGVTGGKVLSVGPVRPIRRSIATTYLSDALTKVTVTDPMILCYTQETSEGPKANLVDGDRTTYWHSAWSSGVAALPHWVKITFPAATKLGAVKYYFRNNTSLSGRPSQFALETSTDGINWTRVWTSQTGISTTEANTVEKTLAFDKNYSSVYTRVMFLATNGNTNYVTLGDMSFYAMGEILTDLEAKAEENY